MNTPENREYIQRQRLYLLGEVVTMRIMIDRPPQLLPFIIATLKSERSKPTETVDLPAVDVVNSAAEYLQVHSVAALVDGWLAALLESKADSPIDFSIAYFVKLNGGVEGVVPPPPAAAAAAASPTDDDAAGAAPPTKAAPPATAPAVVVPAATPPEPATLATTTTPSPAAATETAPHDAHQPSTTPTVLIVQYSGYGHVSALAEKVAHGAAAVADVNVVVTRIHETLPTEVTEKMHLTPMSSSLPVCTPQHLVDATCIAFGFPTRFGTAPAQVQSFLDSTGQLWMQGQLVGKGAGVFVSSATQHGGQETTILHFHKSLLHHGMIVVGSAGAGGEEPLDAPQGGSPYGPTTIAGPDGSRQPSAHELSLAEAFGKRLATIATKLVK